MSTSSSQASQRSSPDHLINPIIAEMDFLSVALTCPSGKTPVLSDAPPDRRLSSLADQIPEDAGTFTLMVVYAAGGEATERPHTLNTAARQLSESISAGAFARCTPAERQQLHTLTKVMTNRVRGAANFAHGLDSIAHQLATSLTAGGFAGCTTQERMQLHILALFLVEAAEQAQALTARARPTFPPVQAKIRPWDWSAPGDRA